MTNTDIVTALRVLNHHTKKLAENESLHDLHREAFERCETLTWQAAKEIELLREQLRLANIDNFNTTAEASRLRAERDEARREWCIQSIEAQKGNREPVRILAKKLAEDIRGWDCFKDAMP